MLSFQQMVILRCSVDNFIKKIINLPKVTVMRTVSNLHVYLMFCILFHPILGRRGSTEDILELPYLEEQVKGIFTLKYSIHTCYSNAFIWATCYTSLMFL